MISVIMYHMSSTLKCFNVGCYMKEPLQKLNSVGNLQYIDIIKPVIGTLLRCRLRRDQCLRWDCEGTPVQF